ncbi:MAG: LysR family transcriptional regulator [bacterium]
MIDLHNITSQQLRIFLAVMNEGSLGRAAKKVYLSQPAVSQAIAALEQTVGTKLFHRTNKGVIPTPAAHFLKEGVNRSDACLVAALNKISELGEMKRGSISIASSDTLSLYLLPKPLSNFRNEYPDIELRVTNRSSDAIVEMVKNREVDIGLISNSLNENGISVLQIDKSPMVLIMPAKSGYLSRNPPTMNDIANLDLILLEKSSRIRQEIEQAFTRAGISLKVAMEVSSFEVAKTFVREGLASSLLPAIALTKADLKDMIVNATPKQINPVSYGLISLFDTHDPATRKFMNFFLNEN